MKEKVISKLVDIRNIGPKMAEKIYNAGIYHSDSMVRIGTEDVYLMIDNQEDSAELIMQVIYMQLKAQLLIVIGE